MTALDPSAPAPAAAPPAVEPAASGRRGRAVTAVLWAALLLVFAATCAVRGLPTDRVVLLGWVLAGLAVTSVTHGRRRLVRLLADWLPLVAVLLAYDATRGLADGLGMPVAVEEVADADRWLTGGVLPTVWLQEHVQADWWKAVATLVYSSHFVVTPVVLAVLWLRDRARWARCARLVVALSLAGLVTYVLYPAAPPWLAAKQGVIEPVARISSAGWEVLGLPRAGVLLDAGQGQVNLVAAVPSLHTAFAVLVCTVLLPLARHGWQRACLVAYAVLMPVVLVWSGEHYVVDTLLGAAYACAVVLLAPPAGRALRAAGRAARPLPWRA
ncbi:phosphatase PAP2 family protein [Blastococcus sp. MG754426]|uniref:phosphatase PAP2 family protein n=1 Tax=unclassified Blastococcus TaxID=2619396 RepID=UPI001EEFC5BF|nr:MULTISPECIES: phosphatase PAP2 family protein [unclassified Blastococcus]MCF6508059.1 phosphatase PAP2 family protein [Blastococcus sp. MG754426]MCF6512828.1 phosphatase PAP2 family protein [Blastococcus sp. MG754427]